MKISVYDNYFLSGKHGWLQSFTMYVQLILVIMYMCTRKVIGSHRSLLKLFHVNVFANESINSRQSSWSRFKTIIGLTGVLILIRFNVIYLNPRGLLSAIVLLPSMKQARQSIDYALHDSSRFWHFLCTDIYLHAYHHCPDHYHTSFAAVTRKRKRRSILCSSPENSELLVHYDWGRPFEQINTLRYNWFGNWPLSLKDTVHLRRLIFLKSFKHSFKYNCLKNFCIIFKRVRVSHKKVFSNWTLKVEKKSWNQSCR